MEAFSHVGPKDYRTQPLFIVIGVHLSYPPHAQERSMPQQDEVSLQLPKDFLRYAVLFIRLPLIITGIKKTDIFVLHEPFIIFSNMVEISLRREYDSFNEFTSNNPCG